MREMVLPFEGAGPRCDKKPIFELTFLNYS